MERVTLNEAETSDKLLKTKYILHESTTRTQHTS